MNGNVRQKNLNGDRKFKDDIEPAISPSWIIFRMMVDCLINTDFHCNTDSTAQYQFITLLS